MREERTVSMLRKIVGLSLIAAVISCTAVRLASGGTPARPLQANPASAQASEAPRIENAKLETRTAGATLETTIRELAARAEQPEWVGYSIGEIAGEHGVCCNNSWNDGNCGTCRLEKESSGTSGTVHTNGNIKLEGEPQLVVLYRLDGKRVVKIRVASEDCTLDAGGLPFVWLTGVKASESVALLAAYLRGVDFEDHGDHGIGSGALTAIALQAEGSADQALDSFVTPDQREGLPRRAPSWMGAARGKAGWEAWPRMPETHQ